MTGGGGGDDMIVSEISVLITDTATNVTTTNITIAVGDEWIGDEPQSIGQGGIYTGINPDTTTSQSISGIAVSNGLVCSTADPTSTPTAAPSDPTPSPTRHMSSQSFKYEFGFITLPGEPASSSGDAHVVTLFWDTIMFQCTVTPSAVGQYYGCDSTNPSVDRCIDPNPYLSVEIWNTGANDICVEEVSVLITNMTSNTVITDITIAIGNEWIGDATTEPNYVGPGSVYASINPDTTTSQPISGISTSNQAVCSTSTPTTSPSSHPSANPSSTPTRHPSYPSLSPTNYPSQSPIVYTGPCLDIDGGNWTLVRHAYNQWHPATDNLEGTDEYGTYVNDPQSMSSWSIPFSQYLWPDGLTQFMFSNGDCSKWLITTNDQFTTSHPAQYNATISLSYTSDISYTTLWWNRQFDPITFDADPWISATDDSDLLYGEAANEHFPENVTSAVYNVWIRIIPIYHNITCDGTEECRSNATLTTCFPYGICNVICTGTRSCYNTVITCPIGEECNIHCDDANEQDHVCHGATIIAQQSTKLNFICAGAYACQYATIHCPTNGTCLVNGWGKSVMEHARLYCGDTGDCTVQLMTDLTAACDFTVDGSNLSGANLNILDPGIGFTHAWRCSDSRVYCPLIGDCNINGSSPNFVYSAPSVTSNILTLNVPSLFNTHIECPSYSTVPNCFFNGILYQLDYLRIYADGGFDQLSMHLDPSIINAFGSNTFGSIPYSLFQKAFRPRLFCQNSQEWCYFDYINDMFQCAPDYETSPCNVDNPDPIITGSNFTFDILDAAAHKTFQCNDNVNCYIQCNVDCGWGTFLCPENAVCYMYAKSDQAASYATMHGSNHGDIFIDGSGYRSFPSFTVNTSNTTGDVTVYAHDQTSSGYIFQTLQIDCPKFGKCHFQIEADMALLNAQIHTSPGTFLTINASANQPLYNTQIYCPETGFATEPQCINVAANHGPSGGSLATM
eukprot:311908_1